MTRLLLVEDDPSIVGFLKRGLEAEGYVVDVAEDGREALSMLRAEERSYPLVVLDRMLPYVDGLEVCRVLRQEGIDSLVLMLTAKDALRDKIEGLRVGADDYLSKPFAFDELLARLAALLRRGRYEAAAVATLRVGDLTLDPDQRRVVRGTREIQLTAKEFALLSYMMQQPGKVISRTRLLNNVWGYSFDPGTKVVDVYISYLRAKLDEGSDSSIIHTVRGVGYKIFNAPE